MGQRCRLAYAAGHPIFRNTGRFRRQTQRSDRSQLFFRGEPTKVFPLKNINFQEVFDMNRLHFHM